MYFIIINVFNDLFTPSPENMSKYYRETNTYRDGKRATPDQVAMFYRNRDRNLQEEANNFKMDFIYCQFSYLCVKCGKKSDTSNIVGYLYDQYEDKNNTHTYNMICKECFAIIEKQRIILEKQRIMKQLLKKWFIFPWIFF